MKELNLSVVMPVYNEKNTILKIIDKVLRLDIVKELIVVDDGSTDGTRDMLKSARFDGRVKI
ncbi:MAG: glycosyltransferase, partial [Candidatus Omnitrophica bacterium]|nr:glycosyltransferase [Candidatus Omnitrophota bacterium]